ncbi:hypothetical protein GCM10010357_43780 [Streptomyces luteireticuli]|uniref:Uncharacterized protein n=1 Tax=Streptomyces luteireticuli TaxID=173858 RepID=A0ABP3IQU3_9ACTN
MSCTSRPTTSGPCHPARPAPTGLRELACCDSDFNITEDVLDTACSILVEAVERSCAPLAAAATATATAGEAAR